MKDTDFGKIAFVVNEYSGISGQIKILRTGDIQITWDSGCWHNLAPLDLREMLTVAVMKLESEHIEYDSDTEEIPFAERVLLSQIAYLRQAMVSLEQLNDWQLK